jgi:hypothetical protein
MIDSNFKTQLIYLPGSYGNFVAWCLYTFSSFNKDATILETGGKHGSAHDFIDFIDAGKAGFATRHVLSNTIKTGILIVPESSRIIEYHNNMLYKQFNEDIDSVTQHIDGIELWEKRSKCSQWITTGDLAYYQILEFNRKNDNYTGKLYRFMINEFFESPVKLLKEMIAFVGETCHQSIIDELPKYVASYLGRQKFLNREQELEKFVQHFICNEPYSLSHPTFYDSAWIQSRLESLGVFVPSGVNVWPENTLDLKSIVNNGSI